MDEIDLIRTLRDDIPAPAPAAHARAERAWRRLATPAPSRERRVRPLAIALATLVAAVALGALLASGPSSRLTPAAAALRHAAAVARAQRTTPLPAGAFRYQRIDNLTTIVRHGHRPHAGVYLAYQRNTREIWQGHRGGLQRFETAPAVLLGARDRRMWRGAGHPALPPAGVTEVPLGARALQLPRDPDALYAHFARLAAQRRSRHPAAYVFQLAGEALTGLAATPAERAALFEVLARVPGVRTLGPRTDAIGRQGLAFAMRDEQDPSRTTLLIDPKTARLLERTTRARSGGPIPAGNILWRATYGTARIVDLIGHQ